MPPGVRSGEDAHPRRDLSRDMVIAQDSPHIPQSAGLALHDELPQCDARLLNQGCSQCAVLCRMFGATTREVELEQLP